MTVKIIISQLFGIGAMFALFAIYQQKNRKRLIISKLCADICWVVHYLLLGAVGGMIPNLVGIFRECVFINRENKKWANHILWPCVFILINWALGFSTFKAPINLLPITASTFVTISLWLKKPHLTKIISIPISLTFLIYDIFVGSIVGVINESISIISILIYFIMVIKSRKEVK